MIPKLSLVDTISIRVVLFTILSIVAIPYYFYAGGTLIDFLIIRMIGTFFSVMGIIGVHRWLSHNSFVPTKIGRILMLLGMLFRGLGRPIHYVIAHRMHHVHSDTELDPHSPKNLNIFQMWLGRFTELKGKVSVPRDFYRQKDVVFLNDHYWKLYWGFNIILALIDLKTALIFCPINFAYSSIIILWVIYYAHNGGKQNIEPVNLGPVITYLTAGETLQKNHHDYPNNWDFSGNGRNDPVAWMINKFLRKHSITT